MAHLECGVLGSNPSGLKNRMKKEQKALALSLRIEQQLSLKQISDITGLSKSTLSIHLRDYPLSEHRIKELSIGSQINGAKANKIKADYRKLDYRKEGVELFNNSRKFRDLVFLYWGEGSKYKTLCSFSISNSDPHMVQYIVDVIKEIGYYDNLVPTVHCYEHSDLDQIKAYWLQFVGKPINVYVVKNSKSSKLLREDKLPYGTMRLDVHKTRLLYMMYGAIENVKFGSIV